jgi:carbon-monoxide dehydrogenase medium subunit
MAFEYLRPESLDELFALMNAHGSRAHLLAGGTDLLVRVRKGVAPPVVIDVKRVADLRADVTAGSNGIRIGARAVMSDIIAAETVGRRFPALAEAALDVGSIQIRNRETLAGNICNASPAADTAPALLAYDAKVNTISAAGSRRIPIAEFFEGPGRTLLAADEIVESIDLPFPPEGSAAAFSRLTRRHGVDLAILSLCCMVRRSGEAAFAAGAVGPRPFIVRAATSEEALRRLAAAASPITDLRASRRYRAAILPVHAPRALRSAIQRQRAGGGDIPLSSPTT